MNPVTKTVSKGDTGAAVVAHGKRITIDPISRLEGHGKIDIFLDDQGDVEHAYLQIPELRGFEVFSIGRPAEDMPQITSRICGVCPTAHHMAATKALDDLYQVEPPPAARKIRELVYNAFTFEDHALHVYILSGPDFIVGPDAPAAKRNVVGVIEAVGLDVGKQVISMRRRVRELIAYFGGKVIHPVFGLPGGVSKGLAPSDLPRFKELAKESVGFAQFTLGVFKKIVLENADYVKLITSDAYTHQTHYMGMVDANNKVNFYDGLIRVVDPAGKEYAKFPAQKYRDYIGEHVEEWSYIKFPFLKPLGWKGFVDGPGTSLFAVAPMARLNATTRWPITGRVWSSCCRRPSAWWSCWTTWTSSARTSAPSRRRSPRWASAWSRRHAARSSTITRPMRTASSRWRTSSSRPRTTQPASR
jgi:F420-non-reducing hydrogenase large subunit